jgi:hypothetical protein
MNEDIKRLREAAKAVLSLRGRFPEQHERAQIIDDFQMAAQPELLLRLLDDAERLDWLLEMLSVRALDEIEVFSPSREAIDQARKA